MVTELREERSRRANPLRSNRIDTRTVPGVIWLASYPKSGNTWLRAFLANYFKGAKDPVSINELPNYALGDNFLIHYERMAQRPAAELDEAEIRRLRPLVHMWFATASGQTAFVKTHSCLGLVEGVPLITPQATVGAIYVVRNPLDIAVSFAHHYQTRYEDAVEALCRPDNYLPGSERLLPQFIGNWSQHVESWTGKRGLHRHVLHYEDMLERPKPTFSRLVRFLELPVERRRLERAIRFARFDRLAQEEAKAGFVEARPDGSTRFFRSGRRGIWRDVLGPAEVARMIEAHAPLMRRHGYIDDKGEPI